MRSRIAVFHGFNAPRMGAPYFNNPRGPVSRSGQLGRRSYYVPAREESMADSGRPYRKAYRVPKKRNTPAMARAQKRFKKAAKTCSRKTKIRGSFQACMKKTLKKGKR